MAQTGQPVNADETELVQSELDKSGPTETNLPTIP